MVQGGLFRGQLAVGGNLRLVRQVWKQGRIRFHSAQYKGANQPAERGVSPFQGAREFLKTFLFPQQSGIQKLHQAPDFIQGVFHGSSGQGNPPLPVQGADGAGTRGRSVFNGLRLIQNNGGKMQVRQRRSAHGHAVGCDNGVAWGVHPCWGRLPGIRSGRVHDAQDKFRGEAFRFLLPVAQQGGRGDDERRDGLQFSLPSQRV